MWKQSLGTEAQQTDEVWRDCLHVQTAGLRSNRSYHCPVCNFDLKNVQLKKEAAFSWEEQDMDYVEGKERKNPN